MKTSTVVTPMNHDYDAVLVSIETTPDSFTMGRRNNDLVNWFLIHRIIDISQFEDVARSMIEIERDYIAAWDRLAIGLSKEQQDDLACWTDNGYRVRVEDKIERLVKYYGRVRDIRALANLWLPMDYSVPGQMPESQLTINTEEG